MVTAIICTLDNLDMLKRQIAILRSEVDYTIVVNNGSQDGTREWLESVDGLTVINQENIGAGPGRNAGLDVWDSSTEYVLMLDGGVLPPYGGVAAMRAYLESHGKVDVISPEVATCFTSNSDLAHRRMGTIGNAFPQRCLSGTAYALCRSRAWDGLRFSEEGPFGQAGWGADDNEMQYRWNDAGVVHHDFTGVMIYRSNKSDSSLRIFRETGIWRNQYGSVFEERCVQMSQRYPHFFDPPWHKSRIDVSCVVLGWNEYPMFTEAIKVLHADLHGIPHEIIFVDNGSTDETAWWLDTFALRWQWGNKAIDAKTGQILDKSEYDGPWTGNTIRIDLPDNLGTGYGYNAGFKMARGKYIFYLSGDILPTMGSVSAMKEYLDENDDVDYLLINPWCAQDKEEQPGFDGFDGLAIQGLGNYAGSYAMFKKEIIDKRCEMADSGPFAGPGCGYEEAEFANQMYSKGYRGYVFNRPTYFHRARDFQRSGHPGNTLEARITERKLWLKTRWPAQDFQIVHHQEQPPERHIRRVAVVYKACPDRPGIGGNTVEALNQICRAEHFEPGEEPEGYDNYLYIDNGDYDYFLCPDHAHPSEFWAVDMMRPQETWRPDLEEYVRRGLSFDRVFAAQPSGVEYFAEHGINAKWLPLAADPDYHRPNACETNKFDWIALWHHTGDRVEYIQYLADKNSRGFVGWKDGLEYSQWLYRSRCAINLSRSDEVTLRVFEVMATGVPLVTDRARGMSQLFEEDEHYLGFSGKVEMADKVEWVLRNEEAAYEMAQRAREKVLAEHTFYHRMLAVYGD